MFYNNAVQRAICQGLPFYSHVESTSLAWPHHFTKRGSLFPPRCIEVPVPCQAIERSCIDVQGVSILVLSTILLLDFGAVLMVLMRGRYPLRFEDIDSNSNQQIQKVNEFKNNISISILWSFWNAADYSQHICFCSCGYGPSQHRCYLLNALHRLLKVIH